MWPLRAGHYRHTRKNQGVRGTSDGDTMSGRLVLLPKKSYTPWNTKNVERVLKDEAHAREEQEKELKAIKEIKSRQRLEGLRSKNKIIGNSRESHQHVNLFENEEEHECTAAAKMKRHFVEEEEEGTKQHPASRVYLHQKNKRDDIPFYLRVPSQQQDGKPSAAVDRNNMSFHDPMKTFYYQPDEINYDAKLRGCTTITKDVAAVENASSSSSCDKKKRKAKKKKCRLRQEQRSGSISSKHFEKKRKQR